MSRLAPAFLAATKAEIAAITEYSVAADKRDIWAGLAVRSLVAKEPVATARGWAQLSQLADDRANEIIERRKAVDLTAGQRKTLAERSFTDHQIADQS